MIPIRTPAGDYRVWTKRTGNNPATKVLLLHGGPGATHEYFEAFDSWFPAAGIEYYYYDQLGSAYSDQPDDPRLLGIDRYVEEVEQVRQALGLDASNFYLLGHSWGGILAIEYALKYPQHLKGLVVSNMMSSIPAYNRYAQDVLMPAMDPAALAEIRGLEADGRTAEPRYMALLSRITSSTCCACRRRNGPSRCCAALPTSIRRCTCRCRVPANSGRAGSSRTGTGPGTSRASPCRRW